MHAAYQSFGKLDSTSKRDDSPLTIFQGASFDDEQQVSRKNKHYFVNNQVCKWTDHATFLYIFLTSTVRQAIMK